MRTGFGKWGYAVAFALAMGCSSSGGGGGSGSFTTSVPGNKPLSSLSDAEQTQLCKDVDAYLSTPAVRASECKFAGVLSVSVLAAFMPDITDAMLQSTCTQAVNQCASGGAADAGAGTPDISGQACAKAKSGAADCPATVSEFSACAADIPMVFDVFPACSTITKASLAASADGGASGGAAISGALPETTACKNLEAKCPGFKN